MISRRNAGVIVLLAGAISCGGSTGTGTGDGGAHDGGHDGAPQDTGTPPDAAMKDATVVDAPTGTACPPACTSAAQFCETASCGGDGVCIDKGSGVCPFVYIPVCGCNGMTYSNECARRAAGVAKLHDGECTVTVDGGIMNDGGMCLLSPRPFIGCCFTSTTCNGSTPHCYRAACATNQEGRCEAKPPSGQCWDDSDCLLIGQKCRNATICPCGTTCLVADMAGDCETP